MDCVRIRIRVGYLSMTCTTPLATKTSGVMTLALFTKTEPFEIVTVRFMPLIEVSMVPLLRVEL